MNKDILNHPLIAERYFFPRAAHLQEPRRVDAVDAELGCFYHEVSSEAKTLVHFHGNGEIIHDYLCDFVERIGGMGLNCFLAEYRGYGSSTGRPELGKMLDDVEAIIRGIGQPPENLVLFGRSVGSIFAIHAVQLFPGIAGMIIESGIADPLERLLLRVHPEELSVSFAELESAVKARLNHQEKLSQYKGPVLIMHTRFDGLVDVDNAARLYEWASGPKKLRIFEDGDHNSIMFMNSRDYFLEVEEFLRSRF